MGFSLDFLNVGCLCILVILGRNLGLSAICCRRPVHLAEDKLAWESVKGQVNPCAVESNLAVNCQCIQSHDVCSFSHPSPTEEGKAKYNIDLERSGADLLGEQKKDQMENGFILMHDCLVFENSLLTVSALHLQFRHYTHKHNSTVWIGRCSTMVTQLKRSWYTRYQRVGGSCGVS